MQKSKCCDNLSIRNQFNKWSNTSNQEPEYCVSDPHMENALEIVKTYSLCIDHWVKLCQKNLENGWLEVGIITSDPETC